MSDIFPPEHSVLPFSPTIQSYHSVIPFCLRNYFLVKTSVDWPSKAGAARGARHVVEEQLAEDEWEQWEVGVGVGGWSHVDSLAILSASLTTDFRSTPILDRDNLNYDQGWNEEVKFNFPFLERRTSAELTFVLQRDCPDSTFIFPIAAEAMQVLNSELSN